MTTRYLECTVCLLVNYCITVLAMLSKTEAEPLNHLYHYFPMTPSYIIETDHRYLREWPVACSVPSHCPNHVVQYKYVVNMRIILAPLTYFELCLLCRHRQIMRKYVEYVISLIL